MKKPPKQIAAEVKDRILGVDLKWNARALLEVSTSMIPKHTADALDDPTSALHAVLVYEKWGEFGWIMNVAPAELLDKSDDHQALFDLLDFADARGFARLQLDCDAALLPSACGLPTFDWCAP